VLCIVCVCKILGIYTVHGETLTTWINEDILLLESSTYKFTGDKTLDQSTTEQHLSTFSFDENIRSSNFWRTHFDRCVGKSTVQWCRNQSLKNCVGYNTMLFHEQYSITCQSLHCLVQSAYTAMVGKPSTWKWHKLLASDDDVRKTEVSAIAQNYWHFK
jgi:hypothetical protein